MPQHAGMAPGVRRVNMGVTNLVGPLSLVVAASAAAYVPVSAQATAGVDAVVVEASSQGHPRVRVHTVGGADLRHFELTGPDRIVLDFSSSAATAAAPVVPSILRERIADVRVARFQTDIVRVVIDLRTRERYSVERQGEWWTVTLDRAEPQTRPSPAEPSTPRPRPDGVLEVRVTRVTGTSVYVDAGSDQGLSKGQSIQAERQVGRGRGSLEVLSTTSKSALLGFAGRPFPITRGDGLRLTLPQTRGPDRAVAQVPADPPTHDGQPGPSVETTSLDPVWALPPNVSGRVSMELDGRTSRTEWDPFSLDGTRTFLSPLARLQFSARDLSGGLSVRGRVRAAYRYGSDGVIDPATSVRVYEFDAEKRFDAVPLRMQVGRFFSPYEASSGYWDGLLMRVGGDGAGVGGVVGLEPDRWNQGFSTTRPKVSGFFDFRSAGQSGGIEGDVAVTHVRPSDGRPNQLYVGSSSRIWIGGLGLSHTVQVDQHPETREWIISDLLVQTSVPVTRSLEVHGRWSRREPNYFWLDTPFSYRRDDIGGGATVRWRGGTIVTNVTLHQVDGDSAWTRSASTALRLHSITAAKIGLRLAANVWDAPFGRVSTASLSADRVVGDGWFGGAYRLYRSEGAWQNLVTHQVDATASWTLPDGVRLTGLASTVVGSGILQQRVQVGVSRSF